MPNFSRNEVVLVRYPFSDLSNSKVRPAVVVSGPHPSNDLFIIPLTSKTKHLLPGEFVLDNWSSAGLNVESAVKRGIFTIDQKIIIKSIGTLGAVDVETLEQSIRAWLTL